MQTIFSVFATFAPADAAVHELQEQGFQAEDINVVVHAQLAKSNLDEVNRARVHVDTTDAIGQQELSGLALLVMNEQPVEVRGLGQIYAAGQMATILANSTVASSQTGEDVQSMLVSYGVPTKTAAQYQSTVAKGGVMLWVRSDDQRVSTVTEILRRHHGQQVMTNQ
ncbi:MAG: hypothetical protein R3E79_43185 [Caldilineaceae bacterium]